ncbi:SgrR family transcriptional regulator [Aquibacillus rhizosphaerae]|uniref:ABC transporter substrate-binding protein n=1 Tax=Aquibacillus rhizosphaerae TaxID=3051431 RepID=A0ABT7L7G1_9BACI|nr:SgrR family transcriptional regulator [Aquibacillus sp. LR5S19]MDL4841753.1 ABC transporter substrate-binding protein [Aquibacillus sp. LR5S19]
MKELAYFEMRAHLYSKELDYKVEFKLKDLEQLWFCTQKNVKRKLKKYQSLGLLHYKPGIGRGNPSTLEFTKAFKTEIEEIVAKLVEKEQLDDLVQLLQLPIPREWITTVSTVQKLFGYTSTIQAKDILRTVTRRKLTTLHPMYSSITLESHLIKQLGDTLVRYEQETDQIKPHLAHHWRHNETYTSWTFYLRKGVLFHNHQSLTSLDVKSTMEWFRNQDSPNDWLLAGIEKIECINPYTVRFDLKEANPFFLRYISSLSLAILPKDIPFDENSWIGTGPFKLVERTENKLVLEAFDFYFFERPLLDRVEVWQVPVDAFEDLTYKVQYQESNGEPFLKKEVEPGFRFLSFNFNRNPKSMVHNKHFREAIFHLLDTEKMWDELDREDLMEASSFLPWNSTKQDRDSANIPSLLKKANYQEEKLHLFSLYFPKALEEANWFIQEADKYGMKFHLHTFDIEQLYTKQLDEQADLVFLGEIASLDYHLSFIGAFYNKALLFRKFLTDDQLSFIYQQLAQIKRQHTHQEREVYVSNVERYLREEFLIIFQHHPIHTVTFDPMIKDIQADSFNKVDFSKLWIE